MIGSVRRIVLIGLYLALSACASKTAPSLWQSYDEVFKTAKYVDLTHTITPTIPVWSGFGASRFGRAVNPKTGEIYSYQR